MESLRRAQVRQLFRVPLAVSILLMKWNPYEVPSARKMEMRFPCFNPSYEMESLRRLPAHRHHRERNVSILLMKWNPYEENSPILIGFFKLVSILLMKWNPYEVILPAMFAVGEVSFNPSYEMESLRSPRADSTLIDAIEFQSFL